MGRKKALIIAISEYDNDYPLKYCEKDGTEVAKLLSSPNLAYEIEEKNKLIGRVKSQKMKDAIVDFFQNEDVKPEDMLLFYYSGHGIPEGTNTYLSPSEIDPNFPIKRGFSFKDLRTVIEDPKSVSGTKVVILDCCHSGALEIGKGEIDNSMQLITSIKEDSEALEQGEGICILAASQPYQGAYPLEEQGYSIFTYYMLEGLRDDSNGNVTPYSLNRYISNKINNLPPERRPRQKPLMRSETSGEIVLASYPKKPPIMPVPSSPTESDEAAVHKVNLASKSILIGVGIAAVVAVVLTLALFNQPQQTLLNNKNVLNGIGDYFFGQGNYTQAIQYYDKVLNIDPNSMNALYSESDALNYLGNYTQAIQILDKALAKKPNDETALNDRGYALNGLGKYKEAITDLDKILAIDSTYKWPFYNKAYALNGLGKYKEAITNLDKALALDRNFSDALNIKGAILDRLGNATKFLEYENSTYGIKMQYPSDWILIDYTATDPVQTVASFQPQRDDARSNISIQIEKLTTKITPDQYLNSLMRWYVADYKYFPGTIRFNQNTTNNIVLAGHPGYLLNGTFRDPTSDALQKFTNIGTIIGDKAYHVIYYSPAYTYPVYLPTFTQMIKSFEVIP